MGDKQTEEEINLTEKNNNDFFLLLLLTTNVFHFWTLVPSHSFKQNIFQIINNILKNDEKLFLGF